MSDEFTPRLDIHRFDTFSKKLTGMAVSHIWRGYGSALFFEFGQLTPHILPSGRKLKNDQGEMGLAIEWSWRIENETSIVAGSWSDEEKWIGILEQFIGSKVTDTQLFGRLPEIQVSFSNGMYVCSMMTSDGDPSWSISERGDGETRSVSVDSGTLIWKTSIEQPDPGRK